MFLSSMLLGIIGNTSWFKLGEAFAFFLVGSGAALLTWTTGLVRKKSAQKKKDKKHTFDINKIDAIDVRLVELLSELRTETASCRARIFRFHNGGEYFDGEEVKRMSCTHESVTTGVSHEIRECQGILCNQEIYLIEQAMKDTTSLIAVEALDDRSYIRSRLESQNVKAFVVLPLYKKTRSVELLIGFIRIEYTANHLLPKDEDGNLLTTLPDSVKKFSRLVEGEILKD